MRIPVLVAVVVFLSVLGASCGGPCAYGPSEIRSVNLTSAAGANISEFIAFQTTDKGLFTSVESQDAPASLTLTLADDGVKIAGSVAEKGTYSFQILVREKAGDTCAAWARYDVWLTVN